MADAGSELEAFRAYADVYPDDCLLLVDTIDTLDSGIPNAITVFEELCRRGHRPVGVRLDSGDLAHLAVRSAALLDQAGFEETSIVLSSELDELTIWQIRNQIVEESARYTGSMRIGCWAAWCTEWVPAWLPLTGIRVPMEFSSWWRSRGATVIGLRR